MLEFLQKFFSSREFIPHGHCYLWKPELVRLHLLSDLIVALAYYSIPIMLVYFVRQRHYIPFGKIFWLFSAFIAACGTTHLMEVWTLWHPTYWLAGTLKAITALISLLTAVELFSLIPQAIALPSSEALEKVNRSLAEEIKERQQIETALRESDRKFRAIFNQSFQFIGLLKADGTVIEANQTALNFTKLKLEDVIARPFWEIHWWKAAKIKNSEGNYPKKQLQEAIAKAAQGEFVRYEIELIKEENQALAIDFSLKPIKDKNGHINLIIAEGRDISERKRAEAEIYKLNQVLEQRVIERTAELEAAKLEAQHSASKMSLAMNAAQIGSWDWNPSTNLIEATVHCKRIFDYGETEQMTYENWRQKIHQDDLAEVEEKLQRASNERNDYKAQYRIRWSDGSWHWVNALGRFDYDAQARPVRAIGMIIDITDQKQAEEALRASEEFNRQILESSNDCIKVLDLEGRLLYMNAGGQRLMEIDDFSSCFNLKWEEFWDDIARQTALDAIETAKAGGMTQFQGFCPTKTGKPKWWEVVVTPIYNTKQQVERLLSISRDITDRKQFELQLQQQATELLELNTTLIKTTELVSKRNQELDKFAYVVSHDLKAPLRAIAHLSEWIEEDLDKLLPEENKYQMQLLRKRVYRLEALINGLLAYSRIGRFQEAVEIVDVGKLLYEVIDSLAPPATFRIEIQPSMPIIKTKRLLLFQVFANLIGNAIDHHDRLDGHISITALKKDGFYEFTVTDDGPGIESQYHEKIFVIFQTLKARDEKENTGIGLSIVKKIIETEGGKIALESALGKETTFRFSWRAEEGS